MKKPKKLKIIIEKTRENERKREKKRAFDKLFDFL